MQARTRGIVLKRSKVSSDDVLVKLFTRDYGLLKFYVNWGRHPKSRLASFTQLFSEGLFDVELKSSLSTIKSVELVDAHQNIVDDYDKFLYASFFLELVDALTPPGEPDPKLYDFLSAALKALEKEEAKYYKKFQCFFMLKLLKRLGYSPVIGSCASCSTKGDFYHFNPKAGGSLCPNCLKLHPPSMKLSEEEYLFIKSSLEKHYALLPNTYNNATMFSNVEGLILEFIYHHVSHLPFKSHELLKTVNVVEVS